MLKYVSFRNISKIGIFGMSENRDFRNIYKPNLNSLRVWQERKQDQTKNRLVQDMLHIGRKNCMNWAESLP